MNDNTANLLTEVRIPYMGSVENVRILEWNTEVGAPVSPEHVLCQIETDKTVMEINAPASGVLVRQLAEADSDLKVGDLIAYLAAAPMSAAQVDAALGLAGGEPVASPGTGGAPGHPSVLAPLNPADADKASRVRISPYARRLGKEHGIEPASLASASGRVTGDDVLRAAQARVAAVTPIAAPAAATDGAAPTGMASGYEQVPYRLKPHSPRRKVIARRLAETARTVPHLTADVQVDMTRVLEARKAYNGLRTASGAPAVSVLAFLARAACAALKSHPELNATYTEAGLMVWQEIHLGIAVDTEDGLVVPVIRHADRLSVSEFDAAIKRVAALARDGKLTPADLEGGTFTISNPGSIGPVLRAEAILNAPQVALLGFPAVLHAPLAVPDGAGGHRIEARPVLRPSLTFDHRPLDGGAVVRYLGDFKNRLETMVFDW
ncbi:dihydrolipoamide acetyltransferase family protein [Pseudoduganella namucuonensis]|uniref:dihydrolipoamide acetyltransferase family protein n=1 Tax=Pseudoduganella namucuonensis TaxID=1035707 RepID=UPI0015A53154|nr:dihydrolipoamide acetyltransferase family protein [Pseudoduganella namucuonensis]